VNSAPTLDQVVLGHPELRPHSAGFDSALAKWPRSALEVFLGFLAPGAQLKGDIAILGPMVRWAVTWHPSKLENGHRPHGFRSRRRDACMPSFWRLRPVRIGSSPTGSFDLDVHAGGQVELISASTVCGVGSTIDEPRACACEFELLARLLVDGAASG